MKLALQVLKYECIVFTLSKQEQQQQQRGKASLFVFLLHLSYCCGLQTYFIKITLTVSHVKCIMLYRHESDVTVVIGKPLSPGLCQTEANC